MSDEMRILPLGGFSSAQPQPKPQVHPDGRVTLAIEAPGASSVQVHLKGEHTGVSADPIDLSRGGDGRWTVTVGPVNPGFHYYDLIVDGFSCRDPEAEVYWGFGRLSHGLEVPDPELDFYLPTSAPHGDVRLHYYRSRISASLRRAVVYTPPAYEESAATRYPVLYLQHGAGECERCWTWQGKANFILDNLIAAGRAVPMILAMDHGYALAGGPAPFGRHSREENVFGRVLVEELVPEIDRTYRTLADREQRAVAGLSMGAGQALRIGLGSLDVFAGIGAMSGGGRDFDPATSFGGVFASPDALNRRVRLLWLGSAYSDRGFGASRAMHEALARAGVEHVWFESEGGHDWQVWRRHLHELAPRLFCD